MLTAKRNNVNIAGKNKGKRKNRKGKARPGSRTKEPSAHSVKVHTQNSFTVVGIGASAGGLEALTEFFRNVPAGCGSAFIVIAHLAPDYASLLPELLQKQTAMNVIQAKNGTPVKPDNAYVIPPGKDLAILHGTLHLTDISQARGTHMAIDSFFQTLALDQGSNAVAVVLSGTGTDGTSGIRAVKEELGMVMAQTAETAKYGGMPASAIATGLVDLILPPAEMPEHLMKYAKHRNRKGGGAITLTERGNSEALQEIFILLRNRTNHDLSQYKKNTLYRRIEKRMHVQQIDSISDYVKYLRESKLETDLLFKELLIGVTSFFRDPEAFAILQTKILPGLLARMPEGEPFRVWVPGCSTGEEACSIAIVLHECMDAVKTHCTIQVFGTDLNASAVETARAGLYPSSICADVTPDRLNRYFSKEEGAYRVKKIIREMLVFAPQNIIKDPPFTKLNMLCCRNLLIYLGAELQKIILPVFHYCLKPGGVLFLGPSETIGTFSGQFAPLNKKWKIFSRKVSVSAAHRGIEAPFLFPLHQKNRCNYPEITRKPGEAGAFQVVEAILRQSGTPPCAVINNAGEIVYIHGRVGTFLGPAEGRMSTNILAMARPGLRKELAAAIEQVVREKQKVCCRGIRLQNEGGSSFVDLTVKPIADKTALPGMIQVLFRIVHEPGQVAGAGRKKSKPVPKGHKKRTAGELELELKNTRVDLQTTIEELETSNEELTSAIQELQSVNEELQSTNEELETSKEELQSLNEETVTVNAELQSGIEDLSAINDDMKNLLDSTQMAAIFLNSDMNVKRFTPAVADIFPLLQSDIGRPLAHFTSDLKTADLQEKALKVLETLSQVEEEVESREGAFYIMRIIPYRTVNNAVDGVVITFGDISRVKEIQAKLVLSEERFRVAITASPLEIVVAHSDCDLKYTWVYSSRPGFRAEDAVGKHDNELGRGEGGVKLFELKQKVLETGTGLQEDIEFCDPEAAIYRISAEPLYGAGGELAGVTTASVDITER